MRTHDRSTATISQFFCVQQPIAIKHNSGFTTSRTSRMWNWSFVTMQGTQVFCRLTWAERMYACTGWAVVERE